MIKKIVVLFLLIITTIASLYACKDKDLNPTTLSLEDSIKEILLSKGEDYDFLSDEQYLNKIADLGFKNKYVVGNLDDDNIPEIAEYVDRDPEDTLDKGELKVYKFVDDRYIVQDSIPMNYDNKNYLMVIGSISPTQNGLLFSNEVGAHSNITYGYILHDGKLQNILNSKKIPLVSISNMNEIKDIDGDGVLEFSIYSMDPESTEQSTVGSDKITLWYKWDGNDSANLINVERNSSNIQMDIKKSVEEENISLDIPVNEFIQYISENMSEYSRFELTNLVESHINDLESKLDVITNNLNTYINEYGNDKDFLWDKYGLSIERLNNIEYLKRDKVLQSEEELKKTLIQNNNLGYKLTASNASYKYYIDYQRFLDNYGKNITNEYRAYLSIKAIESNEPFVKDDKLVLSREKLAERIAALESFRLTYPYTLYMSEIDEIYKGYTEKFIFSNENNSIFDEDGKYNEGSLIIFRNSIEKYPNLYFSDVLKELLMDLNTNNNILNTEIKDKTIDLLNI